VKVKKLKIVGTTNCGGASAPKPPTFTPMPLNPNVILNYHRHYSNISTTLL